MGEERTHARLRWYYVAVELVVPCGVAGEMAGGREMATASKDGRATARLAG